ncbi:MAG: hypothetical protein SCM11_10565 [Bacillota bacterium]|nr:hypothetical protein [Bacillota bacterium]
MAGSDGCDLRMISRCGSENGLSSNNRFYGCKVTDVVKQSLLQNGLADYGVFHRIPAFRVVVGYTDMIYFP